MTSERPAVGVFVSETSALGLFRSNENHDFRTSAEQSGPRDLMWPDDGIRRCSKQRHTRNSRGDRTAESRHPVPLLSLPAVDHYPRLPDIHVSLTLYRKDMLLYFAPAFPIQQRKGKQKEHGSTNPHRVRNIRFGLASDTRAPRSNADLCAECNRSG